MIICLDWLNLGMLLKKPTIFRSEAVTKYCERQDEAVFPRFLRPKTFRFLWLLLVFLLLAGILAWFAEVPQFVTGQAVVIAGEAVSGDGRLAILVPTTLQTILQVGQAIYIPTAAMAVEGIQAVEPDVLSPAEAAAVYNLPPGLITAPTIVISTSFEVEAFPAEAYVGSLYPARIQVGSQRLVTKMPLLDQLWSVAGE